MGATLCGWILCAILLQGLTGRAGEALSSQAQATDMIGDQTVCHLGGGLALRPALLCRGAWVCLAVGRPRAALVAGAHRAILVGAFDMVPDMTNFLRFGHDLHQVGVVATC